MSGAWDHPDRQRGALEAGTRAATPVATDLPLRGAGELWRDPNDAGRRSVHDWPPKTSAAHPPNPPRGRYVWSGKLSVCPNEMVPLQIDLAIGAGPYLLARSSSPRGPGAGDSGRMAHLAAVGLIGQGDARWSDGEAS